MAKPPGRSILESQQFINAVIASDRETVLDFLKYNPDAWKWREDRDGTPDYSILHWAVAYRRAEMVSLLIKNGADKEIGAKRGIRPLMMAAREGDAESVAVLLENGAQADATDEFGKTALDHARKREAGPERKQILEWLEEATSDPIAGRKPKSRELTTLLAKTRESFLKGASRPVGVEKAVFRKKDRPGAINPG